MVADHATPTPRPHDQEQSNATEDRGAQWNDRDDDDDDEETRKGKSFVNKGWWMMRWILERDKFKTATMEDELRSEPTIPKATMGFVMSDTLGFGTDSKWRKRKLILTRDKFAMYSICICWM